MLVFEALDSITTVSKTPTKVKIRHSSAFLGSATKFRVEPETIFSSGAHVAKSTSTQELCDLLENAMCASGMSEGCSLLSAEEADHEAWGSVVMVLETCSAGDFDATATMTATTATAAAGSAITGNAPHVSAPQTGALAKIDALPAASCEDSTASPHDSPLSVAAAQPAPAPAIVNHSQGKNYLQFVDENMCQSSSNGHKVLNSPVAALTTPSKDTSRRRSSFSGARYASVMNSCTKVLQDIDNVVHQNGILMSPLPANLPIPPPAVQ